MTRKALDYAILACDTMIKKFAPQDLPPVKFHYHQGVFLSGMQHTWHLTGDTKYYNYIKDWVDSVTTKSGEIIKYKPDELDDMQPGILLFELYEKTGDERYKKVLETIAELLKNWTCNPYGGFWHKGIRNQMWMDGMYMGGPIMTELAKKFGYEEFYDTVHLQMTLMRDHARDPKTGLFYHAWDPYKEAEWADKETGCSAHFWGRAMGWYAVAMFEIAELMPADHPKRQDFIDTGIQLINDLLKYQDADTGLWYQVVDKGDQPDNWTEVSCSCLYNYALCKAINMGYLGQEYHKYAQKAYQGVIDTLGYDENGGIQVQKVCIGTGINDYEGYINRPTSTNDLHGMGAFLLMCCEYHTAFDGKK